jgi:hypothetical protein
MPQEYTVDIILEDAPATASIAGRKYYAHLPGGYLWELAEAYFYLDTSKAAGGADCWLWKLYRGSDDAVLATVSSGGALTQYNSMTLGTDVICDASPTNPAVVYAGCVNSGAGAAMSEGMRIVARFKAKRPGVGA